DENALPPNGDAEGMVDFVEKDGRGFERAVVVTIFEDADAAGGRALLAVLAAVIHHLANPDFSVGTEVDGDWTTNQRLRCDELGLQARPHLESCERLSGALGFTALRAGVFIVRFEFVPELVVDLGHNLVFEAGGERPG